MHTLGVARILYDWIISSFHTFVNLYSTNWIFSLAVFKAASIEVFFKDFSVLLRIQVQSIRNQGKAENKFYAVLFRKHRCHTLISKFCTY